MKITELQPNGFCGGVKRSLAIVDEVINDPTYPRPLYMLGRLVHNTFINKALFEKGVIIIEGKSRLEMIDEISEGTVIFTAHGISDQVIKKAKAKNLTIVNATCPYVNKSFDLIKEKIAGGYTVIYIGRNHHPETEAALAIDPSIILVESASDAKCLEINSPKIALINQTTMSSHDIFEITDILIKKYPALLTIDSVCLSTKKRQDALFLVESSVDLIIVVGDKGSNNTQKLKETTEKVLKRNVIAVESIEDLNDVDLSIYKHIAVTAGTSTPRAIINEIITFLQNDEKKPYISQLLNTDYLKTS